MIRFRPGAVIGRASGFVGNSRAPGHVVWVVSTHRLARAVDKAGQPRAWGLLLAAPAVVAGIAVWIGANAPAAGDPSNHQAGRSLTVYSSLPLQGQRRPQGFAIVNGIRMALSEASRRAGPFSVRYISLDDSTAQAGGWTPEAASLNARKAAADRTAIAYIGEFTSAASAISIPILNEGTRASADDAIPQISPSNTWNGLTTDEAGADRGAPEKYYPAGVRSYLRLAPRGTLEGAGLTDASDADAGAFTGTGIAVGLGAVAAGSTRTITFKVKID